MIALPELIFSDTQIPNARQTVGHRHYRGRNALAAEGIDWNTGRALPSDPLYWDDMFGRSIRSGLDAAKQTMKPALFVWVLMTGIAMMYYFVPATRGMFTALSMVQEKMGVWFPSIGMGLSVGLIVELVKVFMGEEKRWRRENTVNALFNFAVFGLMGWSSHYRYLFQEEFFGRGTSWTVLLPKVMFDQFVWTVIIANPYQTILFLWKNDGFKWSKVTSQMFPFKTFWGTKMLPVLVSNWAFWIPMALIVYCFPSDLQIPLSILAVTIWVLILSILTAKKNHGTA